jgi:hypothetical protein
LPERLIHLFTPSAFHDHDISLPKSFLYPPLKFEATLQHQQKHINDTFLQTSNSSSPTHCPPPPLLG